MDSRARAQARYRKRHPERILAQRKKAKAQSRGKNRAGYMLELARKNARAKGVTCSLSREWFQRRIDNGLCEATGLPFDMVGKATPLCPSIDRVDPRGDYSPQNCRLVIWWLNRALSDMGQSFAIDVFRRFIETVGNDNG